MKQFLIPIGIFVALGLLLGYGLTLNPRAIPSPLVGKPLPAFALPTLADPGQRLGPQDLRGRVYLLNVWASWCVSCRQEHPVLNALARAQAVTLIGLNYKDRREEALRWLAELGDPYETSLTDLDGRVGIDLGVYGVPETFVIDKQGIVRYKHIGPLSFEVWTEKLAPLIQKLESAS